MDFALKAMNKTTLSASLNPFLTKDVMLCTDGSTALAGAARQLGVEHHAVDLSAGIRVDGAWHVQNVNAYHSRLKCWVSKFRGVATCYLARQVESPSKFLGFPLFTIINDTCTFISCYLDCKRQAVGELTAEHQLTKK